MRTSIYLVFFVSVLCISACQPAAPGPYDVVISNGRVVDGTGNAWFYGDLAVRDGRIAKIAGAGMLSNEASNERIDATGLVVAPGFIDIQSHSRGAFLTGDGRVISKVTQGITTEIMGEGWTNAPANDQTVSLGVAPEEEKQYEAAFRGPRGFNAWLEAMESRGVSANIGSFLGAATIRSYAKGMTMGDPSPAELEEMRRVTREAMEDGAFGVASALIYPPGNFATTDELVEIAKAMAPYGGIYITHMRSEADQFLESMDEAIEIGRRGGVPVEIYHLKAAGQRNWHKAKRAIAKIDSARAAGQDVSADMYPYIAGGTGLTAILPPWASADGKLYDNLGDPVMREKIKAEVLDPQSDWEYMGQLATPAGIMIADVKHEDNKQWVGKRLDEIAQATGKDWVDAAMDLILKDSTRVGTLYFLMNEENVQLQLQQPWIKFGTDAGGFDPETAEGMTHPRAYGTYPRILGKYVRDEQVIPLEDAIRKMSAAVARRLGIRDRGMLQEGMYADVVVFNMDTITDRATFEEPHQLSVGMEHVLVNGVAVVKDGQHTNATPGQIVRGAGYKAD